MAEPLLSMDMSAAREAIGNSLRQVPREARHVDEPVNSPVHALQHELVRAHEAFETGDLREDKAPGWVRIGFPAVVSLILWIVIIGLIRGLL